VLFSVVCVAIIVTGFEPALDQQDQQATVTCMSLRQ
jgi:hypothetical protein